jgi:hypothetical protein
MGFFGHWVVVRGARRAALRRLGLQPAEEESAPGWRYAVGSDLPDDLDALFDRAARAGDGTAVGAWVFDSDYGQVIGIGNGYRAAVAIGADTAEEPLEHDAEAFSRWSACAPQPLSPAEVEAIVHRDDVFAEETADELFDRLGLPAPYDPREQPDTPIANIVIAHGDRERDRPARATRESVGATAFGGYVEPLGSMHDVVYVDPVHVPWRELRHVPGLGEGFLGIWDREAPEEPVATFPISRRGEARLHKELKRLHVPVRMEALRANELGGFVAPAGILSDVRIAERDLSYRDARFVLGRGDGFIGIWDRRQSDEPIQRLRPDDAGKQAAEERIYALLFDEELSTKDTPGLRLYLPRTRPEIVKREVPEPPQNVPPQMREAWEQGFYIESTGEPWLIVEEDEDERWQVVMDFGGGGRYHLYAIGAYGEELACRGRFGTVARAQEYAARAENARGEWQEVPPTVPRTLMATLRWAQRELVGDVQGPWFERFSWADSDVELEGARSFVRVFEAGLPTGVLVAAERRHEGESAVYLVRRGDAPRLVYSLDRLDVLLGMLPHYLGDIELGEWRSIPETWPRDLATLGPAVLVLAGIV